MSLDQCKWWERRALAMDRWEWLHERTEAALERARWTGDDAGFDKAAGLAALAGDALEEALDAEKKARYECDCVVCEVC